jgi:hypothetical protein
MANPMLEIQSELFSFVMEPRNATRVVPALTLEDYQSLASRYLARCIVEDPPNELAHSRWAACYELANWFRWLWTHPSAPTSSATETKQVIRKLYMEGDSDRRKALVQGTLEHLFENSSVRDFFADWKTAEPELRKAYDEASEWSQAGGHSPLWRGE